MSRSAPGATSALVSRSLTVPESAGIYEHGRLHIDFDAYEVFVDGQEVRVYLREFELLRFFVQSPNRVFSREQLLDAVWGGAGSADPRTVDVHVRRLRMHIERDDAKPEAIVTVRGVGYKFVERGLLSPAKGKPARSAGSARVTKL